MRQMIFGRFAIFFAGLSFRFTIEAKWVVNIRLAVYINFVFVIN